MKETRPPGPPYLEIFPSLAPDWPTDGFGSIATVAAELPEPDTLPTGALVVLHASPRPTGGTLRRLFRRPPKYAHASVRCTALLARGFARIGAPTAALDNDTGHDVVWGYADRPSDR